MQFWAGYFVVVTALTMSPAVEGRFEFFRDNELRIINSFNSTQSTSNCSQEVEIYSPKVAHLPRRLASCNNSNYWAKDATTSPGFILNNRTKSSFKLEHVDLNCSRINVFGYMFSWVASLELSATATTPKKMVIIFTIRCPVSSGSTFRKNMAYHVAKVEPTQKPTTRKPTTQKPATGKLPTTQKPTPITAGTMTYTDMPHSTSTPPPPSMPAVHDADHKNNVAMVIGISLSIAVVVLLGVACTYHHRERIVGHCEDKHINPVSLLNNNGETTESIF